VEPIAADTTDAEDKLEAGDEFLIITGITEGSAIHRLNTQYADRAVRSTDWVVQVNDAVGCREMIDQMRKGTELKIKFVRQFKTVEYNNLKTS